MNVASGTTAPDGGTIVFDGVAELIDEVNQRQLLWGVVTNKAARFTDPLTRAMPLFAGARAIVSGDTTPHAKPHPAPLLFAASQLSLPPQSCLYVGDAERDHDEHHRRQGVDGGERAPNVLDRKSVV